jgi:hypothetical protein
VQGKLKSMQINQNDVGRSVNETLRLLDAYQFVEKHGVVCPADWKPGADTMEADPDGSLQYFNKAESSKDDHSFAHTLTAITSKDHYNEVTSSHGPVVVCFLYIVISLKTPASMSGKLEAWSRHNGGGP